MRTYLLLGLSGLLAGGLHPEGARAQATVPTFTELRTPSAPGFVLLGVEPTSIEKPTTPSAFATSLQSAVTSSGLRPGYSLEVAPFWLGSHPKLTVDQYRHPSFGQNMLQTLSFSLATASVANMGTSMGFGGRFHLLSGIIPAAALTKNDSLKCLLLAVRRSVQMEIGEAINDETSVASVPAPAPVPVAPPAPAKAKAKGKAPAKAKAIPAPVAPPAPKPTPDELLGHIALTTAEIAVAAAHDSLPRIVARRIRARITKSADDIRTAIKTSNTGCLLPTDAAIDKEVKQYMEACLRNLMVQYTQPLTSREDLLRWQESLREQLSTEPALLKLISNEVALDKERKGPVLDVAFAGVLTFPTGTWDNGQFDKWGVWVTGGYDFGNLNILGVARWLRPVGLPDNTRTFDWGGKIHYSTGRVKIGIEALARYSHRNKDIDLGNGSYQVVLIRDTPSERFDINLNYKFSDDISITSTIGKGFNDFVSTGGTVLTIFGIEYNMSKYTPK